MERQSWKPESLPRHRFPDDWHDTTHVKTDVDIFWALLIWPKKHPHFVTRPTSRLPHRSRTAGAWLWKLATRTWAELSCGGTTRFWRRDSGAGPQTGRKVLQTCKTRRWTSSVCPYNVAENLSPKLLSSMWIFSAVLSSKRGPGIPFSFGTIIDLYISILIHQRVIVWEPHFPCDFNDFLIVTQMPFAYLFQHMLKPPPICCFEAFFSSGDLFGFQLEVQSMNCKSLFNRVNSSSKQDIVLYFMTCAVCWNYLNLQVHSESSAFCYDTYSIGSIIKSMTMMGLSSFTRLLGGSDINPMIPFYDCQLYIYICMYNI